MDVVSKSRKPNMRNIIYYVATSLDGFIAGPNGEIGNFIAEGSGVDQYLRDLQYFDTVIMGKHTYEFGYQFGLKPGQPAYPHMEHYIFSETLKFENPDQKLHVVKPQLEIIRQLKAEKKGTDIYLCGGGQFAGWLLENELIDYLKIKLNPLILGAGIRLFGNTKKEVVVELVDSKIYDKGLQILNYQIQY